MRIHSPRLHLAAAIALAAAPALAQGPVVETSPAGPCHGAVEQVDVRVVEGGKLDCDAGLLAAAGVPGVSRPYCPRYVTVYPAYAKPSRNDEETGFLALFEREIPVSVHFMRCQSDWFLFFPIDDHCLVDRTVHAGHRDHYRLQSCHIAVGGIQ